MKMEPLIRKAAIEDCTQIAKVHIQSWLETYPGIMPEKKLASLNLDSSRRNWESAILRGDSFFVAVVDGHIQGFCCGAENRQNEGCETGLGDSCSAELAALYIVRQYQSIGLGRSLFEALKNEFIQLGHKTMVAWVAEKNPSCDFYAKMNGTLVDRKVLLICETDVPVLAYRYFLD